MALDILTTVSFALPFQLYFLPCLPSISDIVSSQTQPSEVTDSASASASGTVKYYVSASAVRRISFSSPGRWDRENGDLPHECETEV